MWLPCFACFAVFSSPALFQRDSLVERLLRRSSTARDAGNGGREIATEGLLGRNRLPAFVFAPAFPGVVQRVNADAMPRADDTGVTDER